MNLCPQVLAGDPQYTAHPAADCLLPASEGTGPAARLEDGADEPLRLQRKHSEHTVLTTTRLDWAARKVPDAYAGPEGIERVFRGMKAGGWPGRSAASPCLRPSLAKAVDTDGKESAKGQCRCGSLVRNFHVPETMSLCRMRLL